MTQFQSVKSHGEFWDPRKDAEGNVKSAATSADAVECYYLGCEHDQGKDNNSTLHKILHLGIPPHGGAEMWMEKNVWGSHVLDDQLAKISPGSFIRIQWLGLTQPKSEGGRSYHNWEVFQATDVPVLDASQLQTMRADAAKAASAAQPAAPVAQQPVAAPAPQQPAPAAAPAPVAQPPAAAPAVQPAAAPAPAPAVAPVAPPVQPAAAPPPVDPAGGEAADDLPF